MDILRKSMETRQSCLRILYLTYLWTPMRKKLLDDYKNKKYVLINNKTRSSKQQELPTERAAEEDDGPEVIDKWLPEIGHWGRLNYKLSTCTFVLNVISISILIYTGDLFIGEEEYGVNGVRLKGILSFICHLPRIALHRVLKQSVMSYSACAASILHLIWRFSVLRLEGQFALNPVMFLLIDAKSIENSRDTEQAESVYGQYGTLELVQSIVLYKIEDKLHNSVRFRARPNRTVGSRAELINIMTFATKITISVWVLASLVGISTFTWTLLMEPQVAYLGCGHIELFTFTHLYRLIGSYIVCTYLIIDTVPTLMYPTFIAYVLIKDLMLYWRHVHSMLAEYLSMMRKFRTPNLDIFEESDAGNRKPPVWHFRSHNHDQIKTFISSSNSIRHSHRRDARPTLSITEVDRIRAISSCNPSPEVAQNLDAENLEIRSILSDFFAQLGEADRYVSLMMAYAWCIWLGVVAVAFVMGLEMATNLATAIVIRGVQLSGLMILLILTGLVLTLKRATEPAYRTICSIMAHDPSVEKRRWVQMLKYYTGRHPKHAFTIAHSQVYTLGIFLEFFSYTFTFGLYLKALGILD